MILQAQHNLSDAWMEFVIRDRLTETGTLKRVMKMLTSRIHRREPAGKSMPEATARARIEHVFAHRKNRFGVLQAYAAPLGPRFLRTIRAIGLARAEAKRTLANLACNFDRLVFHERRAAMG